MKEKIQFGIGEKFKENEQGIDKLIRFLDGIYSKDDIWEGWSKYKSFQRIGRARNKDEVVFIAKFEKEYNLAKASGCVYSDKILTLRLLELANWSEDKEKLFLTGVDFERGDSTEQMKTRGSGELDSENLRQYITNFLEITILNSFSFLCNMQGLNFYLQNFVVMY